MSTLAVGNTNGTPATTWFERADGTFFGVAASLEKSDFEAAKERIMKEENNPSPIVKTTTIYENLDAQALYDTEPVVASGPAEPKWHKTLKALHELNHKTDWQAMSEEERVATFEKRYEDTFQDMDVIGACVYSGYFNRDTIIKEYYDCDLHEMESKAPIKGKKFQECYRMYKYGSNDGTEVRNAIMNKYSKNNVEDKVVALSELARCDVATDEEMGLGRMMINKVVADVDKEYIPLAKAFPYHSTYTFPGYKENIRARMKGENGTSAVDSYSWKNLIEQAMEWSIPKGKDATQEILNAFHERWKKLLDYYSKYDEKK